MTGWVKCVRYEATVESDVLTVDELFDTAVWTFHNSITVVDGKNERAEASLYDGTKIEIVKLEDRIKLVADVSNTVAPEEDALNKLKNVLEKLERNVRSVEIVKASLEILGITKKE